jgi:lysophospholipase L1-like esterase
MFPLFLACVDHKPSADTIVEALEVVAETTENKPNPDWANLGKFAHLNDSLMAAPVPSNPRVVFMGNSITEGWAYHYPQFFASHPTWVNRGISGQTTPQMLVRFRPDVVALKPAAVVILAGINDIAHNTGPMTIKQTFGNIESMAQLAEANGIKVVICSVLPAYRFPWNPGMEPALKVVQLNLLLEAFSKEKGYVYLDYFRAMADDRPGLKEGLHEDEVHPNAKGYEMMAPMTEAAVAKALGM